VWIKLSGFQANQLLCFKPHFFPVHVKFMTEISVGYVIKLYISP
jgi:hypothetical protein